MAGERGGGERGEGRGGEGEGKGEVGWDERQEGGKKVAN